MIHEAYMPVYMGSRFLARDGTGRGPSKVVQEVLADLKNGKIGGKNPIDSIMERLNS